MTASKRVPGVVATSPSASGAAAYFSLMTDFHGCVKPSGRERTWPHRGGGSKPICAARIRADLRPKWVEFFRAWSESHWAYGDRTVPRAAEHFRPEDGTRCGSAWDYFHSAWIDPFILYWCGASLSDGFEKLRFDPYTNEDFRLSGVPFVGRCYTFSQKTDKSGRRVRTIFDADGRVLAVGEGALEVMLP